MVVHWTCGLIQIPWSEFLSNLSWSSHITSLCKKSTKLVGLLYRRFSPHSSPFVMLRLYESFVWPSLEYAAIVWSPYCNIISAMRRSSSLLWKCFWKIGIIVSYSELLSTAGLPTLEQKRIVASLLFLYKITRTSHLGQIMSVILVAVAFVWLFLPHCRTDIASTLSFHEL